MNNDGTRLADMNNPSDMGREGRARKARRCLTNGSSGLEGVGLKLKCDGVVRRASGPSESRPTDSPLSHNLGWCAGDAVFGPVQTIVMRGRAVLLSEEGLWEKQRVTALRQPADVSMDDRLCARSGTAKRWMR